jgi:carboxylesterase
MVVKNSHKTKVYLRKISKVLLTILIIYVIFFIYSNLDLSQKRDYVYYSNISIFDETIIYNSQIIKGAEPIFLPRGKTSVLLLHGMGGTPIELKELAYYLADRNISVFVPLLPNQGRSYSDLKKMNAEEVYNASILYLDILKKNSGKVFVGGLSTGGSISLKIAENENVSGIISLATPVTYGFNFLGDSTLPIFDFLSKITPSLRRIESGLAKNESVAVVLPSFDRLPVSVLLQGELLKDEANRNIEKINQPILILQSISDNRAAPSSAQYIFDNVNSISKTLIYLNNSGHVISMDYDKEQVFREVFNFISRN